MKKNIYAFLIPLITLSVIAFTPIFDSVLEDFKFKINLVATKTINVINDKNATRLKLTRYFKKDLSYYKDIVDNNIKDKNARIAGMNYFYYLNERSLATVSKGDYDKRTLATMKYDELMKIEFQKVIDSDGGKPNFSFIGTYKSKRDVNKLTAIYAYSTIVKNKDKYTYSEFMGDDINYTASPALVY